MIIKVDLPEYDDENGLDVFWEKNGKFKIDVSMEEVVLSANTEGLISFAKQMLYLAYNQLPQGSHIHYDSFFTGCNPEFCFIIEKKEDICQ